MTRPAKTTEQFVIQAKSIHGDRYDYSLVEYLKIGITGDIYGSTM